MTSFRFAGLRAWRALPVALALGTLVVSGCGKDKTTAPNNNPSSGPGGRSTTITIVMNASGQGTMAFTPNPDTVKASVATTWQNTDATQHTVTSDAGSVETYDLVIPGGNSANRAYSTPGTYTYHCKVSGHNMHGTVVVEP